MKFNPIAIGTKFGELTVIAGPIKYYRSGKHRLKYLVRCVCGVEKEVPKASLDAGHSKSCGCLSSRWISDKVKTHGLRSHPLNRTWNNMKQRCSNPNNEFYEYYGGRGIEVCEEWRKSLKTFHDWAVSNGWEEGLTIERIDGDKGYCPENCKWIPFAEQIRNRSNTFYVDWNGARTKLIDIYESMGDPSIPYYQVCKRVRLGWDVLKAVTQPLDKRYARYKEQTNEG